MTASLVISHYWASTSAYGQRQTCQEACDVLQSQPMPFYVDVSIGLFSLYGWRAGNSGRMTLT
jgi:hypothetical protein